MPLLGAIGLIVVGLSLAGFGFWASGQRTRGLLVAGNLAAPVGVLAALVGTVLAVLPEFFG